MSNEPGQVLVVDDDEHDIERFLQSLEPFGASPITFDRAFEAVSYIEGDAWHEQGLQLVLLDWKLPGTGAVVLEAIRRSPMLQYTPVVVLSRSGEQTDIRAAYEAGASAYVMKADDLKEIEQDLNWLYGFWLGANKAPASMGEMPW